MLLGEICSLFFINDKLTTVSEKIWFLPLEHDAATKAFMQKLSSQSNCFIEIIIGDFKDKEKVYLEYKYIPPVFWSTRESTSVRI